MATTELSRIDSYQYPSAHLGHLTANQQSALESFKDLCQKADYYRPADAAGTQLASHDDETLLRYLRARKFNPQEALKQFTDTEDWRKENKLDELYETIDVKEYEETRRLYPQWTGRRDRRGIPVYLFEVAHLNSKNIAAYESNSKQSSIVGAKVPVKMLRLFALYENLTRFVMPLCSAIPDRNHPETPISQSNNIVDISNVGLKQFWNLKAHMQDASQLATAHYPETLDRIFIIGAPAFFPTVWGWIKRWFDPITVSKIFILTKSNMKETLEQYIEPANIPKKYGGLLDYEFGKMPILEPAIAEVLSFQNPNLQDGKKTIPTGPIRWEESADGSVEAVAVGSEGGKPRRQVVASLAANTNLKAMHGSSIAGATPEKPEDQVAAATGTYTHPAADANAELLETPPSDSPSTATPPTEAVAATTATTTDAPTTTTQLPDRTLNPTDSQRAGTSETRYADQDGTHAAGQLSEGTPHAAVNDHGHGDKTVTMEPRTVGQAPKDVSQPVGVVEEEAPAPGYVEQAKEVAGKAYESAADVAGKALAAVGVVGKEEEGKKEEEGEGKEEKKEDSRIDGLEQRQVEEFLREKNTSHA